MKGPSLSLEVCSGAHMDLSDGFSTSKSDKLTGTYLTENMKITVSNILASVAIFMLFSQLEEYRNPIYFFLTFEKLFW